MTDIEYERELKQKFNNSIYYVRALCKDRTLYVEVEQKQTGQQWKNQFVNSYIEEMTTKTGNFKTFDKFCRMIYSALQSNNNGSVYIDLLTYQDLEILKARKAAKSGLQPQSLNTTQRTKNKRYLILTYIVEFDRVHYPLALKLDENSMNNNNNSNNRCATDTVHKLLSHSIHSNSSNTILTSQSNESSESKESSLTSSPNLLKHYKIPSKHYHSTPNLNENDSTIKKAKTITNVSSNKLNEILEENIKLKMLLKQQNKKEYPSDKLTDIIEVLEDEIKILKKELEKKNMEVQRITRSTKQFQQKKIAKRLDDLEDEIERLSTQLLSERTKYRRINRQFNTEKIELNKQIEMLQASNDNYQRKYRSVRNELNSTKQTLDNLRRKASKQRLYYSTKSLNNSQKTLNRRSRSRNNNKYYTKRNNRKKKLNTKTHTNNLYNNRQKLKTNNKYYRSSSAPRFQNKSTYQSRSRSPSVRFDPTEWAKNRKEKIDKAKALKNTFGNSRSPSPFRTSRSVSPMNGRNRSKSRYRNKSKIKKRDRSNSRKRNSFGTTISTKSNKSNKRRLPLHPNSNCLNHSNSSSSTINDTMNDENDLINSMEKRQKRILSMNMNDNTNDNNDNMNHESDEDSIFNPTKEIQSIDSRLNALQKFLRAAKSSS